MCEAKVHFTCTSDYMHILLIFVNRKSFLGHLKLSVTWVCSTEQWLKNFSMMKEEKVMFGENYEESSCLLKEFDTYNFLEQQHEILTGWHWHQYTQLNHRQHSSHTDRKLTLHGLSDVYLDQCIITQVTHYSKFKHVLVPKGLDISRPAILIGFAQPHSVRIE